ncbi:mucin-binding protein [Furfurilactobacillus entadae]|uniref:mucin-binding protein n=1 Tax=Furfurilactobacillus entadae TaxID=2922307 RepID=UPI0035E74CEE
MQAKKKKINQRWLVMGVTLSSLSVGTGLVTANAQAATTEQRVSASDLASSQSTAAANSSSSMDGSNQSQKASNQSQSGTSSVAASSDGHEATSAAASAVAKTAPTPTSNAVKPTARVAQQQLAAAAPTSSAATGIDWNNWQKDGGNALNTGTWSEQPSTDGYTKQVNITNMNAYVSPQGDTATTVWIQRYRVLYYHADITDWSAITVTNMATGMVYVIPKTAVIQQLSPISGTEAIYWYFPQVPGFVTQQTTPATTFNMQFEITFHGDSSLRLVTLSTPRISGELVKMYYKDAVTGATIASQDVYGTSASIDANLGIIVAKPITGYTATNWNYYKNNDTVVTAGTGGVYGPATLTTDKQAVIFYYKSNKTAMITYVDDTTGQPLATDLVTGLEEDPIEYETTARVKGYEAQGYQLVSDGFSDGGTGTFTSDSGQQTYAVYLKRLAPPVTPPTKLTNSKPVDQPIPPAMVESVSVPQDQPVVLVTQLVIQVGHQFTEQPVPVSETVDQPMRWQLPKQPRARVEQPLEPLAATNTPVTADQKPGVYPVSWGKQVMMLVAAPIVTFKRRSTRVIWSNVSSKQRIQRENDAIFKRFDNQILKRGGQRDPQTNGTWLGMIARRLSGRARFGQKMMD